MKSQHAGLWEMVHGQTVIWSVLRTAVLQAQRKDCPLGQLQESLVSAERPGHVVDKAMQQGLMSSVLKASDVSHNADTVMATCIFNSVRLPSLLRGDNG